MNNKRLKLLTAGVVLGMGFAVAASVAANGGFGKISLFQSQADAALSFSLTASDFTGSGFSKGGLQYYYGGGAFEIDGNVITLKKNQAFYTAPGSYSGSTKNNGRKGGGLTRVTFDNFDTSGEGGSILHVKDSENTVKKTFTTVSADMDLTDSGNVSSENRVGFELASGAQSVSFTKMTLYYECVDVNPSISITTNELSVGVGETGKLDASSHDVFGSDEVSYTWISSDTDVATVTGNGLKADVLGVAAGNATITVKMTLNTVEYTDTLDITVTEVQSEIVNVELGNGSYILGNQVFTYFDTTSTGKTAAQITALGITDSSVTGINNTIQSNEIQSVDGYTFRIYTPMKNGAVGLNDQFAISYDFKDNANHIIYRATAHYNHGEIENEIQLSLASLSVEENDTLEVTASKASFVEGEPTFEFVSSDTDVFTVSAVGGVATITGVAVGNANLTIRMTVGTKVYTLVKQVAVTEPGVAHNVIWYTDGTDNQRNHWAGAGVWTWVKYGEMGYDDFASFSAKKSEITVSYESDPATTIRVDVISDDIAAVKACRIYLVAGAEYTTGTLTMTIPDANGVTCTGTIVFESGEAVSYNA